MIQIIPNLPANVAGFRATGEVNKDDYTNILIPEVERILKQEGEIRFLLELDNSLKDFTLGAIVQDLGIGVKHLMKWHKMAIVSNSNGIRKFTDFFSYIAPGEAKGFEHDELPQAIAWVSQ